MKIVSFALIVLPGAFAAFPEELYRFESSRRTFDISGGQCADPNYDVAGFTSAEECKKALGDEGADTSNFQAVSWGGWFNGCFKNNWAAYYNTGFNGDSAVAQHNAFYAGDQYLCKKKPPTAQVQVQAQAAPTAVDKPLPSTPPTEVFESEKCDPKECDNWNCKSWCKCFKAHPEIIEIFEGPNPSASEQAIRDSCPSDGQHDCDCTEFHFGNAKKEVAGGQSGNSNRVTATSMIPSTYAAGKLPANIVFTQTIDTALVATDKIVITTTGSQIFAADGMTYCVVNDGSVRAVTVSYSISGVLNIVMNAPVNAGSFTVDCSSNLAANGADGTTRTATVKTTTSRDVLIDLPDTYGGPAYTYTS